MTGQMSLFDFVGEEEKKDFDIPMPNVGEYDKETMLAFEKEVLAFMSAGIRWKNTRSAGKRASRR